MIASRSFLSPMGSLALTASPRGLVSVRFGRHDESVPGGEALRLVDLAAAQLQAYFSGHLTQFDIPLDVSGTTFQLRVWEALQRIPYGETRPYGELAADLGDIKTTRAVGRAAGANPVAIIIPCHRLIGADGSLTGYAGGVEIKAKLLRLERSRTAPELFD